MNSIARNDLRMFRAEPTPHLVLAIVPLGLMPFFRSAAAATFGDSRLATAYSVTAVLLLFSLLGMSQCATAMIRERVWGTYDELRLSGTIPAQALLAKAIVPAVLLAVQMITTLLVAWLAYDIALFAAPAELALLLTSVVVLVTGFGLWIGVVASSLPAAAAAVNLLTFGLAGLGGSFARVETLPGWLEGASAVVPTRYVLTELSSALADGADLRAAATAAAFASTVGLLMGVAAVTLFVRRSEWMDV